MSSSIISAELATVEQLFTFKRSGFALPPFPGYSDDQWGIKAHNRAWMESAFKWNSGMRVAEVGGAYSTLPAYLAEKYGVESWVVDDFGAASGETDMWSRWGNPRELVKRYPNVQYVFEQMGINSPSLPDSSFDCIFSVSTLEHMPISLRPAVLMDIERCLKPGGVQLHTIDISTDITPRRAVAGKLLERVLPGTFMPRRFRSELSGWREVFTQCGFVMKARLPSPESLLNRSMLVESADVIYRFYPPNNEPKAYRPAASLLVSIRRDE